MLRGFQIQEKILVERDNLSISSERLILNSKDVRKLSNIKKEKREKP